MKKLSIIALLVCALCMCTVAVSAEIAVEPKMETENLVSVQVTGTAGANDKVTVLAIEGVVDADGAGTTALQQYTQRDLEGLLANVTYIGQKTASGNAASFSFVPRNAVNTIADNTISLYISDGTSTVVKALDINSVKYTLTFESEGVVCKTVDVNKDTLLSEAVTAAAVTPSTRMGYTFAGWTLKDGVAIGEADVVTDNVTVYAKWNANFAEFATDTGYCTSGDPAVETGVISVSAKLATKEGDSVGEMGFYVWRGNSGISDAWTANWQAVTLAPNVGAGNSVFTIVTDIPQANFAEGVVILPYGYLNSTRTFASPQLVKLEGELKYLGDLEALKKEIADLVPEGQNVPTYRE